MPSCGLFFKFYNRYAGIAFAVFALSEGFDIFDALLNAAGWPCAGHRSLAMYDADVFQMCQISVVQIFIEGGEGAFVYRFAQQIDLRGNGEGLGHPELAGICFGHRRVIVASLDANKVFMFVEVRMMPHCTKRLPFASGRLLTVPALEPHGNNAHGIAFLSCSGFNAGALGFVLCSDGKLAVFVVDVAAQLFDAPVPDPSWKRRDRLSGKCGLFRLRCRFASRRISRAFSFASRIRSRVGRFIVFSPAAYAGGGFRFLFL